MCLGRRVEGGETNGAYRLISIDTMLLLQGRKDGDFNSVSGTIATDGTWYDAVCVCDGTYLKLYVDGLLVDSSEFSVSSVDSSKFCVGGNVNNYVSHAKISKVSAWNRALTVDEVSAWHAGNKVYPYT